MFLRKQKTSESWYRSFLPIDRAALESQQHMLYTYMHVITGFAARLTQEEVTAMQEKPGFVSAQPEKSYRLHTTHSPHFLGLLQHEGSSLGRGGEGVIIGMMDTGIFPSHPSFDDAGMQPPPASTF